MTTKIIGIKEYRQNITSLWKEARKKKIRYIVMYHAKPIFEVNPLSEKDELIDLLRKDIAKSRGQAKKGDTIAHETLMKEFGLK